MKKTLILIMFAIAGLTAMAQYQPVRMVQPLNVSHYRSLVVSVYGNGHVNVVQDVDDYVVFNESVGLRFRIWRYRDNKLSNSAKCGVASEN